MATLGFDKPEQVLRLAFEDVGCLEKPDKIGDRTASCAKHETCLCAFTDQLNLFKLDHELSSLWCHHGYLMDAPTTRPAWMPVNSSFPSSCIFFILIPNSAFLGPGCGSKPASFLCLAHL